MNKIKILMIIMISFGFFASPAIAACILPNADFFYGVTIDNQSETNVDNQSETNVSNDTRKNLPSEVDLKEKKAPATLPDDILAPEFFYGYSDLITGGR